MLNFLKRKKSHANTAPHVMDFPAISEAAMRDLISVAQEYLFAKESIDHGDRHWRAVTSQAMDLAQRANMGSEGRITAFIFGVLHDCRRENDHHDPDHGERAADLLADLAGRGRILHGLPPSFLNMMEQSLFNHDRGMVTNDTFEGLGWDADRSTLARVGITPKFQFFSVIKEDEFYDYIRQGVEVSVNPPSWDEIIARMLE